MSRQRTSNRRSFLRTVGAASVLSSVPGVCATARSACKTSYAYVGCLGAEGGGIEIFRANGKRWTKIGRAPSHAPVSLALHPSGHILYAANRLALYKDLPRGTVEVFLIDKRSGALSLVQRRPLSLSGTEPRNMAVSPDGRRLLVSLYGGGAYNVLPIQPNGHLGEVCGILKEVGCGVEEEYQSSAHPHTLLFDNKGGFVLTSDLGCDQLSVFTFNDEGGLKRSCKVRTSSGAGPGSMILHPSGSLLYVKHELVPAIACHRYQPSDGVLEKHCQIVTLSSGSQPPATAGNGLSIDASGRFLYAISASGIAMCAIDPQSGLLSVRHQAEDVHPVHLSTHNGVLHALDGKSGSVLQFSLDAASGRWNDKTEVASVASPVSLAMLSG